jgi:serine/threonine protein kinase
MSPSATSEDDRRTLYLPFECLHSIPEGINEVRVWWDPLLGCERVGKRMDLSGLEQDGVLPEPTTLQAIKHDNIVPVVTAAYVDGDYPSPMKVIELVTPFFSRGSITDALLRGETFSVTQAVAITQAALRGLREMHEVHRILHRDVKSGNILLADDHSLAKIADLGLAGRLDSEGQVKAVNNPTLYSPPEFALGEPLTPASDVYPMSLVLLELLGGALPYATYTRTFVMERLQRYQCPVRSADMALPIWTPRDLRRIIKRASARDLSRRYATAREMDEDLAKARVVDW